MAWPILDLAEHDQKVFVLLDPDAYLLDPNYKASRRAGSAAIRNLLALSRTGEPLWEAELPEPSDYYYKLTSAAPLTVLSLSSYRCEIDATDGRIVHKEFFK